MEASMATKPVAKPSSNPIVSSNNVAPPSSNPLPSLADFLSQINAGSSSSSTLPLDAQHSLISAQRGNVESSLASELNSQGQQMRDVITKAAANRKSLRKLERSIDEVEAQGQARPWADGLTRALQEFQDAKRDKMEHELLIESLEVVQRALVAIEALEETVAQGRLDDETYRGALDAAEAACEPLRSSSSASHGWLAGDGNVRAIWDLQRRLRQCRERADQMLDEGWQRSIQLEKGDGVAAGWKLTVTQELNLSPSSDYATPLAALLQALDRKGKLKDRTRSLSALLADRLLSSCLSQHCEAREAQEADASKSSSLIFAPSKRPSQSSGLEALQLSLRFIGAHIFPTLSKERQADFSRNLLPKLVQPILTSLRATLPSRDVPADTIPARLQQTRALAHAICSTLTSSGLLLAPGGPSDQSPEDDHLGQPSRIATFANDVGRQYITKVANEARDEARRICSTLSLKDEKGWEAEEIEVDSELPPPPAHQLVDPSADGMEAKEVEGIVLSQGPNGGGGGDEWQWGDDDDGETAQPAKSSPRASLQRANSTASQNSNGSGGAPSSSAKAAAAKRAGRSALGGVRIVKPQDQMGSGPLPGEGGDEDDAWGFDDEADDTPAPISAPVTKPQADVGKKESRLAPPPPVLDDEDDAWFADDEPPQPSTAANQAAAAAPPPPPASFAVPSSAAASTQPKAAPVQDIGEDDEDAWFTDEKQFSSGPPSSALAPPPPSSSSSAIHAPTFAAPVDAGDHSDDAWFNEEAHSSDSAAPPPLHEPTSSAAVEAPTISGPSHADEEDDDAWFTESAPSSSLSDSLRPPPAAAAPPAIEVDVDEDAWGLSEEEKAKRASMLVMGNHPALQALRDPEPPARAASGSSALADQVIDDDFDEDAWGLSSEERAAKRASRLFPAPAQDVATDVPAVAPIVEPTPPSSNLVHPIEPSQARTEESFSHYEPVSQQEAPLTEENLEAAAAERESQAPAIETPLAIPSTLQPGASGPPSVVSTVSAIAPGSPRSGSARSTIAVPAADTTRADDTAGSALETAILADNVSVAGSDVSRTHPFPIESALPESLPASDGAASEASLPATPRTGGQAPLSSDSTFDRLGAAPPSEAAEADDDGTAPSPFPVESAQPVSASGVASPVLVATNSTSETLEHIIAPDMVDGAATPPRPSGPPSIASLPPTPSAERLDFALDDTQEATSVSRPAMPTLATAASQASSEMGDDPTVPFPIHSAVPLSLRYPHRQGSLSSSAPRTGPSSVASDSGAGSDAALPPSPMPERADDHDDAGSGWGFDEDDEGDDVEAGKEQEGPVASRGRAETAVPSRPPVSLLETVEPAVSTQKEPRADDQDDDDPWAGLDDATPEPAADTAAPPPAGDSQPLTKQALQTLSTEQDALQASEAQAKETSHQEEESAAAPVVPEPAEQEGGWNWDDEAGETAPAPAPAPAAPSSASSASRSPVAGRSRALSPLRNATKTTVDASSPRSTASPQLRQATLRSASQARAAAAATVTGAVAGIGAAAAAAASSRKAPAPASAQPPSHPVVAARETQESPQVVPDAPRKETCRISSRSRQLVRLAHSLIDQAVALRDAAEKDEAAARIQTTALLDPTLADIFDLHLALFTPEAASALQQVPALSMQFVNDCRFLSREIMGVEERASKEFPAAASSSSLSKRLTTTAQRTSLLATRHLTTHLSSHASHLSQLIATGCDSFLSVYNDERFASCQRSLTQALATVSGLDRSWRGTLSDSQRWTAIGALWEGAVVKRVWSDVLALDDVGEKEGERLAELIRGIGDDKVAGSFTMTKSSGHDEEEEQEAARGRLATYVPSHLKLTGYLPEMLIGSLADVEYLLFDGGALAPPGVAIEAGGSSPWYVSRDEAKGLIRATFADSRRRTDLLARVARGV